MYIYIYQLVTMLDEFLYNHWWMKEKLIVRFIY